jgi:hypothetical protein
MARRREADMRIPDDALTTGDDAWAVAVRDGLGPRRYRLYLSGCLRGMFPRPLDPVLAAGFDTCDRFADTGKTKSALTAARRLALRASLTHVTDKVLPTGTGLIAARHANTRELFHQILAVELHLRLLPLMGLGARYNLQVRTPEATAYLQRVMADFVAPTPEAARFDARWRTADVVDLARGVYRAFAFDRMPALVDALMDAGCDNDAILAHCRAPDGHVRGCWVLDLILDGQWETAWQEPKSPKAKAPKSSPARVSGPFKLTPAAERQLDEVMKSVGQWSAAEAIANKFANVQAIPLDVRIVRQVATSLLGLTNAHVQLAFECLPSATEANQAGFARRIALDDPKELAEYVCLAARADWIHHCDDEAGPMRRLHPLIFAAAVHDRVLERRFLERGQFPLRAGQPDDICEYNAVYALLVGNVEFLRGLFPHTLRREPDRLLGAKFECFAAVAANDPEAFARALEEHLAAYRRTGGMFGLIDVSAHGIYELCRRAAPGVVSAFDVNHPPPWDAAFYRWVQACDDPFKELDWDKVPKQIRIGLRDLTRPVWWGAEQR